MDIRSPDTEESPVDGRLHDLGLTEPTLPVGHLQLNGDSFASGIFREQIDPATEVADVTPTCEALSCEPPGDWSVKRTLGNRSW